LVPDLRYVLEHPAAGAGHLGVIGVGLNLHFFDGLEVGMIMARLAASVIGIPSRR